MDNASIVCVFQPTGDALHLTPRWKVNNTAVERKRGNDGPTSTYQPRGSSQDTLSALGIQRCGRRETRGTPAQKQHQETGQYSDGRTGCTLQSLCGISEAECESCSAKCEKRALVSHPKGTLNITHLIQPVGLDDNTATVNSRFQDICMTSGPNGGVVRYLHHVTFE